MEIRNNVLVKVEDKDIVNGTFEIPSNVTEIGRYAFFKCECLESINIPNNVIKIDDYAFSACKNLKFVNISSSVTTIGNYAFSACKSLENVDIASGVTVIGDCAFFFCDNLKSIDIPDSVRKMGFGVFDSCTSLKDVELSNSMNKLRERVFSDCKSLNKIVIPKNITYLGYAVFYRCSNLKRVIVSSKASVEFNAFEGCPNVNIIHKDVTLVKKNNNNAKITLLQKTNPDTLDEFNSIMRELQTHINNLKGLEIKPLNTESPMTIEKFGDELTNYSMLISSGHYSSSTMDRDVFKRNKGLRKILNQIDNKVSLFEKIGNSFLKEQDGDIVLNKDAMNKLKNISARELDTYRKQTQILEGLQEMIKLYIEKLDMCMQELNTIVQSEGNSEFAKIDNNTLNACIQPQLKRMQDNRGNIINEYTQISNTIILNMTYMASLKEVTEVLLPSIISHVANNRLVISKQESVDAMVEIAKILRNAVPKEIDAEGADITKAK